MKWYISVLKIKMVEEASLVFRWNRIEWFKDWKDSEDM